MTAVTFRHLGHVDRLALKFLVTFSQQHWIQLVRDEAGTMGMGAGCPAWKDGAPFVWLCQYACSSKVRFGTGSRVCPSPVFPWREANDGNSRCHVMCIPLAVLLKGGGLGPKLQGSVLCRCVAGQCGKDWDL